MVVGFLFPEEPFDEATVDMIENELCSAMQTILSSENTRIQIDDSYTQLKRDTEKCMGTFFRFCFSD